MSAMLPMLTSFVEFLNECHLNTISWPKVFWWCAMFIFGLCDILLCLHSFGCCKVLDVCHDILITTLSFLGQQKCFCNNSADIKLKFFPVMTARGREEEGCTSVLITMSSCQQENQVQRHDWRQEKIYKRMIKTKNKLSIKVLI